MRFDENITSRLSGACASLGLTAYISTHRLFLLSIGTRRTIITYEHELKRRFFFLPILFIAPIFQLAAFGTYIFPDFLLIVNIANSLFTAFLVYWILTLVLLPLSSLLYPRRPSRGPERRISLLPRAGFASIHLCTLLAGLVLSLSTWSLEEDNERLSVAVLYAPRSLATHETTTILSVWPLYLASSWIEGNFSASLDDLSSEALVRYSDRASVIVVLSHGDDSGLICEEGSLRPSEISESFSHPRLVYIGGCFAGQFRSDWQRIFPNAQIIARNRVTTIPEEILWLYTIGPVRALRLRHIHPA